MTASARFRAMAFSGGRRSETDQLLDELLTECRWMSRSLSLISCFGLLYTCLLATVLMVGNAHFACPVLYGWEQCQRPIIFGYLILFEIYANVFCFHLFRRRNSVTYWFPGQFRADYNDSSSKKVDYCSLTKQCPACDRRVPTASEHCSMCDCCVLRKDHHCFMMGGCVGFGNQRYFIVFLLWAMVGAGYGSLISARYLDAFFQPFWPLGWTDYLAPVAVIRWILGTVTLSELAVCALFTVGSSMAIGAGGFLLSQVYFVVRGTTMNECGRRRSKYVTVHHPLIIDAAAQVATVNERIVQLFGRHWALNILCPQPWFRNRLDAEFCRRLNECSAKEV